MLSRNNFYIKTKNDNLPLAFDVLSDMVLNPLLKAAEIEREKGVILEEMAMYEDTPMLKVNDVFERLIFKGNTLGRDIIGTKKSIKEVKRNNFIYYRNKHYFAQNMLVTVSGGVTYKEVLNQSSKYFEKVKTKGRSKEEKFVSKQKKAQVLRLKAYF